MIVAGMLLVRDYDGTICLRNDGVIAYEMARATTTEPLFTPSRGPANISIVLKLNNNRLPRQRT